MSKQDRQGVRRPADLEQKYGFGKVFSEQDNTNAKQNEQIDLIRNTVSINNTAGLAAIARLETKVSSVEQTVTEMQEDDTVTQLGTRVDEAETAITNLQTADDSMGKRITAVETAKAAQDKTIANLTERLTSLENTVTGLSTRLTTAETTLSSLEARVAALEK